MTMMSDAVIGADVAVREPRMTGIGTAEKASARLAHVEVIRGLACLMVVAYHVIGNDPAHGMRTVEGGVWWAIPRLLDAVQMPLFAFVSGWVFSIATGDVGVFRAALFKKLMRLALPMASVSLLYLALATATGKAEGRSVLDVLVLPYQHLWYLQASLWLVTFAGLGALIFRSRPQVFAGVGLAISLVLFLPVPRFAVDLLSIEQAIYLAPFFFVGHLARVAGVETVTWATEERLAATLGGLTVVGLAAGILTWKAFSVAAPDGSWIQTVPAFLFATTLASVLMLTRPRSAWLEAIGARSFTIYLFHVFFTAPTREVVTRLWPGIPSPVLFALIFSVGVGVPFVLHGRLARNRWSALAFLGMTPTGGPR